MPYFVCSHAGVVEGGSRYNFLSQVKEAIDAKYEMIEIDVRLTKDGVPILFHDTSLDEDTNGTGNIEEVNWSYIKTIKYNKDGEKIARLEDVIKYYKQVGSKSILQLDKASPNTVKKAHELGLFKGIEKYILDKPEGGSFTTPSIVKTAGIKFMPILPKEYVGKMTTQAIIDEIVSKAANFEYLEAQFNKNDTLFLDGTFAKTLKAKSNCKLLIVACVGIAGQTQPVGWQDTETYWQRYLDLGADGIMTNKCESLKKFYKKYVPKEPKPEEPKPEQAKPTEQVQDEKAKQEADKQSQQEKLATEARLVSSKITLKKKSGPGEIVGVVEGDLYLGNVTFSGLQFTQPGEYVISVIGSSNQLEQGEFTVIVEAAEEIVEQDPSGQDPPISGARPIIAQIDKPTIKLGPIIPNVNGSQPNNDEAFDIGNLPLVFFGSFQIRPSDIKILQIFYDEFVPKCYLTFQDSFGQVNRPETAPTANSTIDIFINSGSDQLKSIHLRFLIDQKKDNRNDTITIFGKLDLKDFYKIDFKSYTGSSFEVLRQVCKELGLGYNSNIVETNDSMKWIRNGTNLETYVRSIISKSYISDSSFMAGYIDYYYCFNYVDVEKEYNRDNTSDIAIASTGIITKDESPDESKVTFQVLTNDKSQSSTPFYFGKHTFMNNATVQLTNTGATTDSKVYDRVNKRFLKFNVDGMVSPDAGLKTLRSEDDINTNYRTEFTGNFDADNVHENYLYAETQNKRNFENLANIIADLILPTPNFNIYKFQKIRVYFVNDRQTATDPNLFNTRYSGDWIIIDISYTYQKSALYQTVRIARKELTKVESELNNETTKQDNTQNNEINENENVDTENQVVPNSIYQVGQEVWLEQNGIMYFIIIENVSENGIEVSGKVKKYPKGLPSYYTGFTPGPSFSQVTPEETQVDNKEPNLDVKTLTVTYVDGDILTANGIFLINEGEVEGIGTASLPPEGKAKQKENAAKAAEINAINKYKAARSVFNAINR